MVIVKPYDYIVLDFFFFKKEEICVKDNFFPCYGNQKDYVDLRNLFQL